MRLPNKKFKVKIVYFGSGKYLVKWASYRFIPKYRPLCFWFEQTLTGGTECWSELIMPIEEAESTAKGIKSVADLNEWYKPDIEKRKIFYERKREFYKKAVPYRSKTF